MTASKTTVWIQAPPLSALKPPNSFNRVGIKLHPGSVTKAWYKAECPPRFDPRSQVPFSDYLRWRVACFLRGASPQTMTPPRTLTIPLPYDQAMRLSYIMRFEAKTLGDLAIAHEIDQAVRDFEAAYEAEQSVEN